jgi:SAM-dependent methyltransferase
MEKISVDLDADANYLEPDSAIYRFKRKLTYRFFLRKIRRLMKQNQRFSLLEVGIGSGFFLSFMEKEFPNADLRGVEYDQRLIEEASERLCRSKVVQGNAEDFDFRGEKFEIVVSFQVIEHLYSPESMLECVKRHLKPEGIFIFSTPNLDGLGAKLMKKKWHGFRQDHVALKGFDEWVCIANSHGFSTIYCGSTFFSGIPLLNTLPLGLLNWALLLVFGAAKWRLGESFVGVFRARPDTTGT